MSNAIEKKTHTTHTATAATVSTGATASTGASASTPAAADHVEHAHRGRKWYEETQGKNVNPTPGTVPINPEVEAIKAADLQDWRKKA